MTRQTDFITTTQRRTPIKVLKGAYSGTTYLGDNSANPIIAVSAEGGCSFALAADGTVYSFGDNTYNTLGDNSGLHQKENRGSSWG